MNPAVPADESVARKRRRVGVINMMMSLLLHTYRITFAISAVYRPDGSVPAFTGASLRYLNPLRKKILLVSQGRCSSDTFVLRLKCHSVFSPLKRLMVSVGPPAAAPATSGPRRI